MNKKVNENELLKKKDIKQIKNCKRITQKNKELYISKKEQDNLDTQIEVDQINNEGKKLDAINSITSKRIKNVETETKLSKLNRLINFNKKINESQKKEIDRTIKRGKKFKKISMIASITSAITTCLGIQGKMSFLMYAICCGIIIFCAIAVNMNINSTVDFIRKFFNGKFDASLLSLKLFLVVGYTAYSITTNFKFWKNYLDMVSVVMFSLIFDLIAIEMAIEGEKFLNLEYNSKYRDEIESIIENNGEENEKNEKKSPTKIRPAV